MFRSVNGIIFPGGLTDLWMDSPYVSAPRGMVHAELAAQLAAC